MRCAARSTSASHRSGLQDRFGQVLVPTEEVIEMRTGRSAVRAQVLPGLCAGADRDPGRRTHRCASTTSAGIWSRKPRRSWASSAEPPTVRLPISDKEADAILQRVQEGVDKPKPKVLFEPGEMVRVIEGPFNDFNAVVEEVNYDKNRLKVAVLIFGRSTPVELEFGQVEKA
jgi:transcriptional antiterminator NusG